MRVRWSLKPEDKTGGVNVWLIVGCSVGGLVVVGGVIGYLVWRRRKARRGDELLGNQ